MHHQARSPIVSKKRCALENQHISVLLQTGIDTCLIRFVNPKRKTAIGFQDLKRSQQKPPRA